MLAVDTVPVVCGICYQVPDFTVQPMSQRVVVLAVSLSITPVTCARTVTCLLSALTYLMIVSLLPSDGCFFLNAVITAFRGSIGFLSITLSCIVHGVSW